MGKWEEVEVECPKCKHKFVMRRRIMRDIDDLFNRLDEDTII